MVYLKEDIKILLADDHDLSRILFETKLRRAGYSQIEMAVGRRDAVQKSSEYRPHIILMDTDMPQLLGYLACQEIRAQVYGKRWGSSECLVMCVTSSSGKKRVPMILSIKTSS